MSDNESQSVVLVLEGERPLSWNKLYSGTLHWTERSEEKNRVRLTVRTAFDPQKATVFTTPVAITVKAYFADGRRLLDADNIASKFYIDALIGWYIEDDTPQYVASVCTFSQMDRENPRVEIHITPVNS